MTSPHSSLTPIAADGATLAAATTAAAARDGHAEVAQWKAEWAALNARRREQRIIARVVGSAPALPAATSRVAAASTSSLANSDRTCMLSSMTEAYVSPRVDPAVLQALGVSSSSSPARSRHTSPHHSPSKAVLQHHIAMAGVPVASSSPAAVVGSPAAPVPSPPRAQRGSRMVAAALAAANASGSASVSRPAGGPPPSPSLLQQPQPPVTPSKLPLKRKLEHQLSGSTAASVVASASTPVRAPSSLTAALTAALSPQRLPIPMHMSMLRPPASPSAAVGGATASPASSVASTPNKRPRLEGTPFGFPSQSFSPSSSSAAAAAASSSPFHSAAPLRPFYHMPAHPLSPAQLFPRSSPSPPAPRPSPHRSPSKRTGLFGALLSGHPGGSGSGGGGGSGRKRLRDVAVLTPGLHNAKGIYSYAVGTDHPDDRAKNAQCQREFEQWQQRQRSKRNQPTQQSATNETADAPHDATQQRQHQQQLSSAEDDESLSSSDEAELVLTEDSPPPPTPVNEPAASVTAAEASMAAMSDALVAPVDETTAVRFESMLPAATARPVAAVSPP